MEQKSRTFHTGGVEEGERMNVWVLAYYDMDWKQPWVAGVYTTKEKAEEARQELKEKYRWWHISEPVEREVE